MGMAMRMGMKEKIPLLSPDFKLLLGSWELLLLGLALFKHSFLGICSDSCFPVGLLGYTPRKLVRMLFSSMDRPIM